MSDVFVEIFHGEELNHAEIREPAESATTEGDMCNGCGHLSHYIRRRRELIMPPTISLNELYMTRREKERKRTASFDKVLELCHKRIRNIASFGGMNTFYEIPGLIVGFPLYNLYECSQYVIDNLRKTGFLVQVLPPPHVAVLYVSWDPEELNPVKTPKHKLLTAGGSSSVMGLLPAPPMPTNQGGKSKKNQVASQTKRLRLFG